MCLGTAPGAKTALIVFDSEGSAERDSADERFARLS
jgi:hypothetical protein